MQSIEYTGTSSRNREFEARCLQHAQRDASNTYQGVKRDGFYSEKQHSGAGEKDMRSYTQRQAVTTQASVQKRALEGYATGTSTKKARRHKFEAPGDADLSHTGTPDALPVSELPQRKKYLSFILNSPAGDAQLPPSTAPSATSSRPLSRDANLKNPQGEVSAGVKPNTNSLIRSSSAPPTKNTQPACGTKSNIKSFPEPVLLNGDFVAQELAKAGKVLIPISHSCDLWVSLSIHALLAQDPLDFFSQCSQIAGAGEVSVLSVALPDVTDENRENPKIEDISRDNSDDYDRLKRAVWDWFCRYLIGKGCLTGDNLSSPGRDVFRVVVALDETASTLNRPGDEIGWRASSKWLGKLIATIPHTNHMELIHLPPSVSHTSRSCCHERAVQKHKPTQKGDTVAEKQRRYLPSSESTSVRIAILIQENEHAQIDRAYDQTALLANIDSVNFFTWFARCTGQHSRPTELKFILKNALPQPIKSHLRIGDEVHFENIKWSVKYHLDRAKAFRPELTEFAVLVTVPGDC